MTQFNNSQWQPLVDWKDTGHVHLPTRLIASLLRERLVMWQPPLRELDSTTSEPTDPTSLGWEKVDLGKWGRAIPKVDRTNTNPRWFCQENRLQKFLDSMWNTHVKDTGRGQDEADAGPVRLWWTFGDTGDLDSQSNLFTMAVMFILRCSVMDRTVQILLRPLAMGVPGTTFGFRNMVQRRLLDISRQEQISLAELFFALQETIPALFYMPVVRTG